ncbi:MAG TPA: hypothetical protein VJP76_00325, partial [Candidatus Tumulicola sp.]|nr:hypothetical protein [Candidatus Tumulicola sp.]
LHCRGGGFDDKVTKGAGAIAMIYRDVAAHPDPYGSALRKGLRAYTGAVVAGWPLPQHGVVPPQPAAL